MKTPHTPSPPHPDTPGGAKTPFAQHFPQRDLLKRSMNGATSGKQGMAITAVVYHHSGGRLTTRFLPLPAPFHAGATDYARRTARSPVRYEAPQRRLWS